MGRGAILAGVLSCVGCASIVGDTTELVTINSDPAGAEVVVRDEKGVEVFHGTTPASLNLEKKAGYFEGKDYTFEFTKPGFQSRVVLLESETSNWYLWGNIAFGGLIGWFIVDPITGAMWKYEPPAVTTNLDPART